MSLSQGPVDIEYNQLANIAALGVERIVLRNLQLEVFVSAGRMGENLSRRVAGYGY